MRLVEAGALGGTQRYRATTLVSPIRKSVDLMRPWLLEAGELRVRLVRDRNQLFVDSQSVENRSDDDWTSFDMIWQFLTGEIVDSAVMDDEEAKFIHDQFAAVIHAFNSLRRDETEKKLHEYEHARAERLFGGLAVDPCLKQCDCAC